MIAHLAEGLRESPRPPTGIRLDATGIFTSRTTLPHFGSSESASSAAVSSLVRIRSGKQDGGHSRRPLDQLREHVKRSGRDDGESVEPIPTRQKEKCECGQCKPCNPKTTGRQPRHWGNDKRCSKWIEIPEPLAQLSCFVRSYGNVRVSSLPARAPRQGSGPYR